MWYSARSVIDLIEYGSPTLVLDTNNLQDVSTRPLQGGCPPQLIIKMSISDFLWEILRWSELISKQCFFMESMDKTFCTKCSESV